MYIYAHLALNLTETQWYTFRSIFGKRMNDCVLLWLLCTVCYIFQAYVFCFPERCDEVLASPLPYSAFTSSSVLAADFGAGYAKLNRRVGEEELYGCV